MSKKFTFEYVKTFIESTGYTLLSDTYKSGHSKLSVMCDKGHEYSTAFSNFKAGNRCRTCMGELNGKRCSLGHEYVKKFIDGEGYTLLSDTYKNNLTKLLVRCDKGHEYEVTFANFQTGWRCPCCAGNKKLTYEYVKSYIESLNYTLLSDTYKNKRTKLLMKCDKGHEFSIRWNDIQQMQRCSVCSALNSSSIPEKEVQQFVSSMLDCDIVYNDRTQIINPLTNHNLELDIWIPSMKKAIEYNGTYWHSMEYQRTKDHIKQEQCIQKGIDLLIVTDHNWLNNNEFERQKIKMWLDNMY